MFGTPSWKLSEERVAVNKHAVNEGRRSSAADSTHLPVLKLDRVLILAQCNTRNTFSVDFELRGRKKKKKVGRVGLCE